jgi:hypothetical protein
MPEAPRFAHRVNAALIEIPATTFACPSTQSAFQRRAAISGLLPYAASRWMLRRVNAEGEAAVFYFHPWEIDADQPRVEGISAKTRFRHYLNLGRMECRLHRLLADFAWGRMDDLFLPHQPPSPSIRH